MRVGTYSLGILLALGASTLGFAACGSNVIDITGGTGGGGTGGAHATSTTVTVSSTTGNMTTTGSTSTATGPGSTTASSSSGAGGGDQACNKACDHIQMCTGFTCTQANINCSTMGMQYDCEFNCAAQTPCNQLGPGTLQKCQAMCADGGTSTDGGMMGGSCQQCAGQNCMAQVQGCFQDMACQSWFQCVSACQQGMMGSACYTACDNQHPNAKPKYEPIYACTCTHCATECVSSDPCNHPGDAG